MDANRKNGARDEPIESQVQTELLQTGERQENLDTVFHQVETAIGTYCEIKSITDKLIILGRVEAAEDLIVSVVSANGGLMPQVIFNQEIRLVLRPPKFGTMVLRGQVCGSTPNMWKIDKIEPFHLKENRAYFRQRVTAKANVYAMVAPSPEEDMPAQTFPLPGCTVLDVSLEGVRFRCAESFERGDWVCVSNLYLTKENRFPFTLIGQICWADRISKDEFMFGCRLAPMGEAEQDALCSSIFTLQRLELQASRMRRMR